MKQELENIRKKIEECVEELKVLEAYECPDIPPIPDEPDGAILELPENFNMITSQVEPNQVSHLPYNNKVGNNRWMSETFNGAYFSVNAWGFGGNAGGTQELRNAYVSMLLKDNLLRFQWFVGGYHRDFNGKPGDGWWGSRGGNDVKGYPRVGIGSASGQPGTTIGAPFDVSCIRTSGWKHIDQDAIQAKCGLPVRLTALPEIKINVDYEMKSNFPEGKDKFGNYFLAVDSYLHDLSKAPNEALKGSIDGITDTSGSIYGQDMNSLRDSTKEWAIMIWLAKSPYFETSGGTLLGNVDIEGLEYIVKYKVEKAGGKKFKYISFTREVESTEINTQNGIILYNKFVDFYTSENMERILENAGPLEDVDGQKRIIKPPTKDLVLSDINFGVEVLSNPDTTQNQNVQPVSIDFKELSFDVEGYGKFGFKQ